MSPGDSAELLLDDTIPLVFSAIFGFVAVFHGILYYRRRDHSEYLWFSLLSLCFGLNTIGLTMWPEHVGIPEFVVRRLAPVSGSLIAVVAVQFLWPFVGRPIPGWLRLYQISQVVLALFAAVAPWNWVIATNTVRWMWLVPVLIAIVVVLIRQARAGILEARILIIGGIAMVGVEAILAFGQWLRPGMVSGLTEWAFAIVVLSMAVALAANISDRLVYFRGANAELEEEVRRRTADLESARDAAETANRAKDDFLATMSHELRTPMAGLTSAIELLADTSLDTTQQDLLLSLRKSGRAQLTLLDDLLSFSRIESGHLELESEVFDLVEVVGDSVDACRAEARRRELEFNYTVKPRQIAVEGDAQRLQQIVLNLLNNAIKFTTRGEVRLDIHGVLRDDKWELDITISDTGIGMTKETLDRIFEPFVQADSSITRRFGGTGLGLFISRRLVEAMGGRLTVRSTEGEGSRFSISLTLPAGATAAASEPKKPVWNAPSQKILLAEDDEVARRLMTLLLDKMGHSVTAVEDGELAWSALQVEPFDVVLLDVHMPQLDGLSLARRVRANSSYETLTLIALTADAFTDRADRILAAGVDAVVTKPATAEQIDAALSVNHHKRK